MTGPSTKDKRRLRRALARRQGMICFYCTKELTEPGLNTDPHQPHDVLYATIDHIRPLSRGGTNQIKNLVLACWPCHKKRHA